MKIVASIEARSGSTRLPNKILLEILGKPTLGLMLERLQSASRIDEIVVATTDNARDDAVEALCTRMQIPCFRGSEDDVLDRVVGAVSSVGGDIVVELTGDCTLMDPALIDLMVGEFMGDRSIEYLANTNPYSWPEGFDIQIFPLANLQWVNEHVRDPAVHEHVSLYFYDIDGRYRTRNVTWEKIGKWRPHWHLSLDERADFAVIRAIYENLYTRNPLFTVEDVVDFLDANPEIRKMNEQVLLKEVRIND